MVLLIILLVIYAGLNVADYVITIKGLELGAKEANPLFKNASSTVMLVVKIVIILIVSGILVWGYYDSPIMTHVVAGSLVAFYIYVIIHNMRILKRLKK